MAPISLRAEPTTGAGSRAFPGAPDGTTTPRAPGLLAGWGRLPTAWGVEVAGEDLDACTTGAVLSRGMGRSYGDASLPPPGGQRVASTRLADRFLAFDPDTGLLRGEAGLTVGDILRVFLPRGWSLPVMPGTQFATLGGMVAADVHGKNHHHAGTFGEHVRSLRVKLADDAVIDCSDWEASDLFLATLGGMGLTGHILEVELFMARTPSPWIWCESERIADLDALLDLLKRASRQWPFTAAWIDAVAAGARMGRGILQMARWADPAEAPPQPPREKHGWRLPCSALGPVLSRPAVKAFNWVYYWKHCPRVRRGIVHPQDFFFPLDRVRDWNRLYGRRGFTQYQCVLPENNACGAARRLLELLAAEGGAFLAVVKDFGRQGKGLLSFPMPGISIAADLPVVPGRTQALVDRLNELVIAEGGRVYLAKDTWTRAEHFRAMEPRLQTWDAVRKAWQPQGQLRSAQSVRLFGDDP